VRGGVRDLARPRPRTGLYDHTGRRRNPTLARLTRPALCNTRKPVPYGGLWWHHGKAGRRQPPNACARHSRRRGRAVHCRLALRPSRSISTRRCPPPSRRGSGAHRCSCYHRCMTLHSRTYAIGVRALHDRLSEHLAEVQDGAEVIVTRRGEPVARLSGVTADDPMQELVRRGLVTPPTRERTARRARVKARGPVSQLVHEQRR
jgi:prevent-host-death family protein